MTLNVKILPFLATFTQLTARLFKGLVIGLKPKEGLAQCATVCVKSEVILTLVSRVIKVTQSYHLFVEYFSQFSFDWEGLSGIPLAPVLSAGVPFAGSRPRVPVRGVPSAGSARSHPRGPDQHFHKCTILRQ